MQSDIEYIKKHDEFAQFLDMTIECARAEYSRVSMPIAEKYLNGMKVVHGGALASLADYAFACAANIHRKNAIVTLSMNITYLRPGKKSPLVAEAKAIRLGGRVLTYDVFIYDGDNELIAKAMINGYITNQPRLP